MKNLTLLQINDLHGYLAPHPEMFDLDRQADVRSGGGLARIATLFRAVRREAGGAVMALDNGDTFLARCQRCRRGARRWWPRCAPWDSTA